MAWIVKDVANDTVDREGTVYLTDAIKSKMTDTYMPRYATKQACLLPICHEVQHAYGYLPAAAMEEIAEFLELSYAEVIDTVTFYEEYQLKPTGKYLIQICRSIGCQLCGYQDLSDKVQKKLGILPGETTDDGRFTLLELECLGACELAPAMLMNEELHGPTTWEALEAMIDQTPVE